MAEQGSNEDAIYLGRTLNDRWRVSDSEVLGGGFFGRVFAGEDLQDSGKPVAIKILKMEHMTNQMCLKEFADEGRILQRLIGCERVVDIFDYGEYRTFLTHRETSIDIPISVNFIVMERADERLVDLLAQGELSFVERIRMLRDAAQGIHQMHLNHTVNRDTKSENILVFRGSRNSRRGKISDMGRARILTDSARVPEEHYAQGRGDLRFSAPELCWLLGDTSEASWRAIDLFHIGSIFYELVTGFGITSHALPESNDIMQTCAPLSKAERQERFARSKHIIQDRFELAYELFESMLPPVVHRPAIGLLRQLTSIEPSDRFPRIRGKVEMATSLSWLIARIDAILFQLRKAEIEAKRSERRKASV